MFLKQVSPNLFIPAKHGSQVFDHLLLMMRAAAVCNKPRGAFRGGGGGGHVLHGHVFLVQHFKGKFKVTEKQTPWYLAL
jgi:hypothetical protein